MIELVLDYSNEQSDVEISDELISLLKSAAVSVLKNENLSGKFEISLTFCSEEEIKLLNSEHRGIDKVTDVLSFPLGEDGEYPQNLSNSAYVLGDIVICAKRAVEQAKEYGHSKEREFAFLCAHSVLHLLGYDHMDENEAKDMEVRQGKALEDINIRRE